MATMKPASTHWARFTGGSTGGSGCTSPPFAGIYRSGGERLLDPAAAQADLAVVEDGGLSGRDRALRGVEGHVHAAVGLRGERGLSAGMAVADLHLRPARC